MYNFVILLHLNISIIMQFDTIKELNSFLPHGAQKRIADKLGYHNSLVSNVLNQRKIKISVEKKQAIIDTAIEEARNHKIALQKLEQSTNNITL